MLYGNNNMPTYLAEIPYGFKNLWRISVDKYDLTELSFSVASIQAITLNGSNVEQGQLRHLYDYNRDGCSLISDETSGSLYVTLTGYDSEKDSYTFDVLAEQNFVLTGVTSVTGDMVDNSKPLDPVILHDTAKLDVEQYNDDQAGLESRLSEDEGNIKQNSEDISELQESVITAVTVNGNTVPVADNTAQISLDAVTMDDFNAALAQKVDKNVAGDGNKIVQDITSSFNDSTRVLTVDKTLLSLEDGGSESHINSYDLAKMLGITDLESKERELFYFCPISAITSFSGNVNVDLSVLYRYNADGTVYKPTATDDIQMVYAVATDYIGYKQAGRSYVSAIGRVAGLTANTAICVFTNLVQYTIYSKYNSYRAGTVIYDPSLASMFQVLQDVPLPADESDTVPLTNNLYYVAIKDYSRMAAGTIWGNFDSSEGPGTDYPIPTTRLKLLEVGAGYNEYVSFIPENIPAQILTDADWNNNISLWVTDGLQFTSRESLLAYLNDFGMVDRYKTSNRGIIITHYEQGGITITPVFTKETLDKEFIKEYQPIPEEPATGNFPIYNSSNILVDSGKAPSDFATAAQGAKADSSVQTVSISGGSSNGSVNITVNGNDQEAQITGLKSAAYKETTDFASVAQGLKADSAVQSVTLSPGSVNGNLHLTVNGTPQSDVAIPGLKSAAYKETTDFASAAQGLKADSAVQSVIITPGDAPGTIQYSINGRTAEVSKVGGLGSAAYEESEYFATAAQGAKADSALQSSDVVNNLSSTDTTKPLSANQGRVLEQLIQSISPNGKPIGGFDTFADAYTNTSQYADDLQPINVNDTIYIAADEYHTGQPAQWRVSSIGSDGTITYAFTRIVPDVARDFIISPIQSDELAAGAVNTQHIQNSAVTESAIANSAVSYNKLATAVKNSLNKADSSLQGVVAIGSGAVVKSVVQNNDKTIDVTYTDDIISIETDGVGDFVTGASVDGLNITLIKDGVALKDVSIAGEGNVLTDATVSGGTVIFNKINAITSINTSGGGNVIIDISPSGEATKGTVLSNITKTGNGNVITGVNVTEGEVTLTTGNAITSTTTDGTGNVVGDISVSGGVMKVAKINAITSLPDSNTAQKGVVQLNNTLTSTKTDQALTAAQGKILSDLISTNDSQYVKLEGLQTIGGTKTLVNDLIVPTKTEMSVTPSSTTYATEAQVATKVTKPASAVLNNIAVFDNNKNVIDSGKKVTDFLGVNGQAARATKLATARKINSVDFDGTKDITIVDSTKEPLINTAIVKTTLADADMFPLIDSAASNATKKITWANIKAVLKAYFDSQYLSKTGDASNVTNAFTQVETLANIASGEKQSTLFGKIAKAIADYMAYKTSNNAAVAALNSSLDTVETSSDFTSSWNVTFSNRSARKNNKTVTISVRVVRTDGTLFSEYDILAIPAGFRPVENINYVPCRLRNSASGAEAVGMAYIKTTGGVSIDPLVTGVNLSVYNDVAIYTSYIIS